MLVSTSSRSDLPEQMCSCFHLKLVRTRSNIIFRKRKHMSCGRNVLCESLELGIWTFSSFQLMFDLMALDPNFTLQHYKALPINFLFV